MSVPKNKRLLFLLRLPPRLTGATLMNSFVNDSQLLRANFTIKTIKMTHSNTHSVVGGYSFKKLIGIVVTKVKLVYFLIFFRPKFVYFQISPLGVGFLRDLLFVLVIKLFHTKIVYHMHGKGIAEEQKKKYFKVLYKWVFKNEDVICLSKSLTIDLADVFKGTPLIVPNVIKNELNEIPERVFSGCINILYISNLFISKGIYVFIKTLELLKEKGINFEAHIIGNESEVTKKDLQKAFQKYGLLPSQVKYLGSLYGEEKWEEYKNAHVLVFPTLNDIWGLVILEAMQSGIPVIASIDGAIPEIIENNETGFLVEKNHPEQICEKLEYLANNPDKLKEMGLKGRENFLANYSFEKFENKMLETFNSICH